MLGRYAVELFAGLPTCLMAPSLTTVFRRRPEGFADWLIIALSQSGRTPEIVNLTGELAAAGATVLAVTNDADSPLSRTADQTMELGAGVERAVPATKTVTSQMLAVLAVASGLGSGLTAADVARIPEAVNTVLEDAAGVTRIADRIAARNRLAVLGRGWCYPAALETALKLQETTGIMAHGFSTADFRHGPIAVCGPDSPAILLAGSNPADADTRELRAELVPRGTPVSLVGPETGAEVGWPRLGNAGECLLATVRGQQLALALCRSRGINPDQPAGLNKVTLTR